MRKLRRRYSIKESNIISSINVTPFVDVMLILLIVFMITSPMIIKGVQVTLPEITKSSSIEDHSPLIISISQKGKIYVNDTAIPENGLKSHLLGLLAKNNCDKVFIMADKNIQYGIIAKTMDQIRSSGILKISLITDNKGS